MTMKGRYIALLTCLSVLVACKKEKCAVYKVHNKSMDTLYLWHTSSKIDTFYAESGMTVMEDCTKDMPSKPMPTQYFERLEAKNKDLNLSLFIDTNWKSLKLNKHQFEHVFIVEDIDFN